jgi:hypothetical protein
MTSDAFDPIDSRLSETYPWAFAELPDVKGSNPPFSDSYERHQAAIRAICDRYRSEDSGDGTDYFNHYFDE